MTSANDRSRREKKKKRRKKKDALATFLYQRSLTMISLNDYVHHLLRAVNENCTFRNRYNNVKESLVTLPLPFCLSAESLSFFYIIDAYYKNSNPFQRTVILKTIDFQMKFHDISLLSTRGIFVY